MQNICLNFYGIQVEVTADSQIILEDIKRDFSYFLSDEKAFNIKITIFKRIPPYESISQIKASLYLAGAIGYDDQDIRYVDYHGQALTVYEYSKEEGFVYSDDNNLLHEISYLLILSRVGELLDKKGIHRVHALGVAINDRAVLCLLPMGAGKTTLALDLLKEKTIKLLSDDIVLIDKSGNVLPFPLRVGVDKKVDLDIPAQFLREFYRRQYGPKTLVDIEYFKDRVAGISKPWIILIGEREFSDQAKIEPLAKVKAIWPFIQNGVIGLGLPQMVEYFLRNGLRDLEKIPLIFSRMSVALKIIYQSKIYKFTIGQNKRKNIETLLEKIMTL